jgi:hypothetical protein
MVVLNSFESLKSDIWFRRYVVFCKAGFLGLQNGSWLSDELTNGSVWAKKIGRDGVPILITFLKKEHHHGLKKEPTPRFLPLKR